MVPTMQWCVFLLLALKAGAADALSLPCPTQCQCFFNDESLFQVDCSKQGLKELPDGLNEQIQVLDLSNNQFETIPEGLQYLFSLQRLNMSANFIKVLPSNALENMIFLEDLDLSSNKFTYWRDINLNTVLLPAINLKTLILSNNLLSYFANLRAGEVIVSESLQTLDLSSSEIMSVYGRSPLSGMKNLEKLILRHNPIKQFHNLISPSLKLLDVSHCELNYIGNEDLMYLPSLTHLVMSHNYRLVLSNKGWILNSDSLKHLDASHCNMDGAILSGLTNIREVNLRGNMIRKIKEREFGNNTKLLKLDLSSNAIGSVHQNAFDGLESLMFLNLSINVIPKIHDDTFIRTKNLTMLNLSRNYISNLGGLKSSSLVHLDVSMCEIQTLNSDAFDKLDSLLTADLSRNLISAIPDNLKSNSLQTLDLSFNRISTINNMTFQSLPELTTLYLSENRFTEIWKVSHFASNTKLVEIGVRDNTWRCDCFEKEMKMMFNYLTEDPPKVWSSNSLICHSPFNVSGRTWIEACYFVWNPLESAQSERALTFFLVIFCTFFGVCTIMVFVRQGIRKRIEATQQEERRLAAEERDRIREMRMRHEQEEQRNAPDPRDLISPPSYDEALLMPRLDGSYHSLADVGLGQSKQKKRARRRTRSSGDLLEEVERSDRRKRRTKRNVDEEAGNVQDETNVDLVDQNTRRSEGQLNICVVHLHESDL